MSKHTPGPWHIHGGTIHAEYEGADKKHHHHHIAEAMEINQALYADEGGLDANAKLIAAAPKMYAALEEAEGIFRQPSHPKDEIKALNIMRAAMRTAEGRTT